VAEVHPCTLLILLDSLLLIFQTQLLLSTLPLKDARLLPREVSILCGMVQMLGMFPQDRPMETMFLPFGGQPEMDLHPNPSLEFSTPTFNLDGFFPFQWLI